ELDETKPNRINFLEPPLRCVVQPMQALPFLAHPKELRQFCVRRQRSPDKPPPKPAPEFSDASRSEVTCRRNVVRQDETPHVRDRHGATKPCFSGSQRHRRS